MINTLQDHENSWLILAAACVIAVLAALVMHGLAYAALRRAARFSPLIGALVDDTHVPARAVLLVASLQMVVALAPQGFALETTVRTSITLLLILTVTWLAARAVSGVAEGIVRQHPATIADNLDARRIQTQTRVLGRTMMVFVLLLGTSLALMTLPGVRQIGTTLLASAGLAGLAAGIAARPVLSSLIAGLQIALTQPIRLDDVVIIENEWGRIEEITATYVVVKIWDERRLVVPLQWVIEHPFQNWTRTGSQLLGTVFLWLDYRTSLASLRSEVQRLCEAAPEWDRRVAAVQVVETSERAMQVRVLVSAQDASKTWDLRCRVRERLIDFVQKHHPDSFPRLRAEINCNASNVEQRTMPSRLRREVSERAPQVSSQTIVSPLDPTTGKGG